MEPSSSPLEGIRRVLGFGGQRQKPRGDGGAFARELGRKQGPGEEEAPPRKEEAPEELSLEQGADAGTRPARQRPRTGDGKGLKVDLLA